VMRNSLLLMAAALLLSGCGSSTKGPGDTAKSETPTTEAPQAQTAPEVYRVNFETSKGNFVIEVNRSWAPFGADRFYELVQSGFYDEARFFRVLKGFVVQWGLNKDPAVSNRWRMMQIVDDPVKESNRRGTITFATGGPNTRTTQVFINLADNRRLDASGFSPFGRVVEGMDVVDSLYGGYGEGEPQGAGPAQHLIEARGNQYLTEHYPRLDYIKAARIVQ
jgi:peptidyl-prolyl cis-trans isomerase A (cyclophilin A)